MPAMPPAKAKPLQEMLNKIIGPKPPLKVDGVFGEQTISALKEFQKKAGVKPTGEVDADTAPVVARAIKTGKIEKDQPTKYVEIGGGKYAGFTDKEWKSEEKKMADKLLAGPVREAKIKAAEAKNAWEHFNELNNDQYIVSFIVETSLRTKLPPKSLIDKAEKAAWDLETLAKAQDFGGFLKRARTAPGEINAALDAMRTYREKIIDRSGTWVTGLEWTKNGSFFVLSLYAAPMAAASLGTGVLASAVIGGAAVKGLESASGEIGNWSAGNAQGQDPGGMVSRVVIDTLVGAVTGWLSKGGGGGKSVAEVISRGIAENIGKKLVAQGISKEAIEYIVKYVMSEGGKKVLEGAVADAAKALKGDPKMSWETFGDNVVKNFGTGVALGPLTKWIDEKQGMRYFTFDGDARKKLRSSVEKEILKKANGEIHIEAFYKEADKMIDKYAAEVAKKALGKSIGPTIGEAILKTVKVLDIKALERTFRVLLLDAGAINECSMLMGEKIYDELKKKKK